MRHNPATHRTANPAAEPAAAWTDPPEAPALHKLWMLASVVVPFAGFVAAIIGMWLHGWMGWLYLNMLLAGWLLTGLGITIGYHRLLSHQAFETYRWVRIFWMMMGALAAQKSPIEWCAVHRRHHALSDRPGDPHSPHRYGGGWRNAVKGFAYAHVGWLFTGYLPWTDQNHYVPDLLEDRTARWIQRYYEAFWIPLTFALPAAIGGVATQTWEGAWLGLLWGGLARVFLLDHITWSINSVAHLFGGRDYEVKDRSRNNVALALLGFGEGWHNNHHAFPASARQGLRWWQFDLSWIVIRAMQLLGLAWNVKLPGEHALARGRKEA